MSGLPRPTPRNHVLELTRRLAEVYDTIPLRVVARVVQDAAAAATDPDGFTGTTEGIPTLIDTIEQVAREDLDALAAPPPAPRPTSPSAAH